MGAPGAAGVGEGGLTGVDSAGGSSPVFIAESEAGALKYGQLTNFSSVREGAGPGSQPTTCM